MRIYIHFSDRPNIAEKKIIIQTKHVEKGKRETKIMKRKKKKKKKKSTKRCQKIPEEMSEARNVQ